MLQSWDEVSWLKLVPCLLFSKFLLITWNCIHVIECEVALEWYCTKCLNLSGTTSPRPFIINDWNINCPLICYYTKGRNNPMIFEESVKWLVCQWVTNNTAHNCHALFVYPTTGIYGNKSKGITGYRSLQVINEIWLSHFSVV